jgi:hypothetical protein
MSGDHVITVFTPQNLISGVNLDFCGFPSFSLIVHIALQFSGKHLIPPGLIGSKVLITLKSSGLSAVPFLRYAFFDGDSAFG